MTSASNDNDNDNNTNFDNNYKFRDVCVKMNFTTNLRFLKETSEPSMGGNEFFGPKWFIIFIMHNNYNINVCSRCNHFPVFETNIITTTASSLLYIYYIININLLLSE